MVKVIAAINMTLDGYCDHTAMIADDQLHEHYNELLKGAGAILYGRVTYQLMESYWPTLIGNPSGNKPMEEFAELIDNIPKVLFSRTIGSVNWRNTRLATKDIRDEVLALKQSSGKDIFVGSPSLIVALANLQLIDEFQICVHPVVLGGGLALFDGITGKNSLRLLRTKIFESGTVMLCYEAVKRPPNRTMGFL